jgi:TPR repeat protein
MRTFRLLAIALALVGAAGGARAFDGTPSPTRINPIEAARAGTLAFRNGNLNEAIAAWTRAAENGHVGSAWRLGRIFADGEGVQRNDLQAFRWFSRIVETHGDEDPGSPRAQIASRAFVEVGTYLMAGIPGTDVRQDFSRALRMFYHAASVFGDADAQYNLGRLYLDGAGVEFNPRLAASWLRSAAEKNHREAQATLGELLFSGRHLPRRAVEGLMWLSLARQQARGAMDAWIIAAFDEAFILASDDERQQAARLTRQFRPTNQAAVRR